MQRIPSHILKVSWGDKAKQLIPISKPGHKTKALWMSLIALVKLKKKNAGY